MNRRTLGILASVVGSAVGAWLWSRQRMAVATQRRASNRDHGTVIFHNNPKVGAAE